MTDYIEVGEPTAAKRRLLFFLVDAAGAPVTDAAGGQPQISVDWAAWTDGGVGVLEHMGNGYYHATLDAATVAAAHAHIVGRFDNASTVECMSINRIEVGGHREGLAMLHNDRLWDHAGVITVYDQGGYAGGAGNALYTITLSDPETAKTLLGVS